MLVQASVGLYVCVCVWERGHFNRVWSRIGGGEEVESAIWMGEKDKGGIEERKKEKRGNSAAHVNSLNAPCWPRGC